MLVHWISSCCGHYFVSAISSHTVFNLLLASIQDLLKDIEVQKANLLLLQSNLATLTKKVHEDAYSNSKQSLNRIEERFQLVNLFFKQCDGDEQYNELLFEFVSDRLRNVNDLVANCANRGNDKMVLVKEDITKECRLVEVSGTRLLLSCLYTDIIMTITKIISIVINYLIINHQ